MATLGNYFEQAYTATTGTINAAGRQVIAAGQGVNGVAQWAQRQVSDGVGCANHHTDQILDTFEHSTVGDNLIGRNLSASLRTGVHFAGGVVEGGAGLATGVVGAAGLAVQGTGAGLRYASDGEFRQQANTAVSTTTTQVLDGTIARNVGTQLGQAWEHDPANFVGQAVGMIGGTILTAGVGTAARGAGTAADLADAANLGGRAARAAEAGQTAGRTGPVIAALPPPPPATAAGLRVAEHLEEAGRVGKPTKGIIGGHRPADFERLLEQGNGSVVSRTQPPGLEGIENVQYRLMRGDSSGEMGRSLPKTLFDEATWPRERLGQLADRLFSRTPAQQGETYVRVGDNFWYTVRDEHGAPRTMGVEDAASVARRTESYSSRGLTPPNVVEAPANFLANILAR